MSNAFSGLNGDTLVNLLPMHRSEEDILAGRTQDIINYLLAMNSACFTVGELLYIQHWQTKVRWMTGLPYEQRLFAGFADLILRIR